MVDSITSAGKKLFSNKERAKRLAKSDRIKREKKGLPFMGSDDDPSVGKVKKKVAKKKGKITKEQEKKFKSLFFVK